MPIPLKLCINFAMTYEFIRWKKYFFAMTKQIVLERFEKSTRPLK